MESGVLRDRLANVYHNYIEKYHLIQKELTQLRYGRGGSPSRVMIETDPGLTGKPGLKRHLLTEREIAMHPVMSRC